MIDGVPLAIKDNILTEGVQSSGGSPILKGLISPINSTAVQRLRDAGAVVVGSANMDEMGMGSFGVYGVGGPVRNPIDERYSAGGSSAGSAAAVRSY